MCHVWEEEEEASFDNDSLSTFNDTVGKTFKNVRCLSTVGKLGNAELILKVPLDLLSNCSFQYNGVYCVYQVLSVCDVIVSQKLYNGE